MIQLGHTAAISSVAFSPNGKLLLSGSVDKTARLWDVATGLEIRKFTGHSDYVTSVAFTSDGRSFVTGSRDKTACLWGVETGKRVLCFVGHSRPVTAVAISSEDHAVLTGGEDGDAILWDLSTGRELRRFIGHSGYVTSVAFSPDGRLALTGSTDSTARIWETSTGRLIRQFEGHTGQVSQAVFSPDGEFILTASEDGAARLWSATSGGEISRIGEQQNAVTSIAFSPDGRFILTGSSDKTARLWSLSTNTLIRTFISEQNGVGSVLFSPDGKVVLATTWDNAATLWNTASADVIRRFGGNAARVESVAFSRDAKFLSTGSADGVVRVWNLEGGQQVRNLDAHTLGTESVVFSADGRTVLTGDTDRVARVWDLDSGLLKQRLGPHSGAVSYAAYAPDGLTIITDSWDRTVRRWGASTGAEESRFEQPISYGLGPPSAAISPDGRTVATSTGDNVATIWETETGRRILSLIGHAGPVSALAFSPDGKWVLTGSWDSTARLWNAMTGEKVQSFDAHAAVFYVGFSQKGNAVTGDINGVLTEWDSLKGNQLGGFVGHTDTVKSAAFSLDAKLVATGSFDGTTRIWDADTKSQRLMLVGSTNYNWAVMDAKNRFDTADLEQGNPLYWVVSDQPLQPLPLEIFMRDYYEPGLLHRVLAGETFKDIRSIATLNRVQPLVSLEAQWLDNSSGVARVTVKVAGKKQDYFRNGKTVEVATGVYDLRLFRDGQLVGWAPKSSVEWQLEPARSGEDADALDLQSWRSKTQIVLKGDGTASMSFLVQVPRRTDIKEVKFTAYAFNEDRVKSATASKSLAVSRTLLPRIGRAYVISVGVNRTESSPNWDLQYAANDARKFGEVLTEKLVGTNQYAAVVGIRLVSDTPNKHESGEASATKKNLETILDVLAGRRALDTQLTIDIPGAEGLQKAQPEDLVLLAFSSHGFTDARGVFHMVLNDIGPGQPQDRITAALQKNSLSSDQLSAWLRDVDAGELTMIVDACHSEATIAYDGFKPGPMGSRGLGQLAYDKGMRILAASKSSQSAIEIGIDGNGEKIDEGLLSYALLHEGLELGKAGFMRTDGKIFLSEWLAYGVREVPNLVATGEAKGSMSLTPVVPNTRDVIYLGSDQPPPGYQQPVLFDFAKQRTDVLLSSP